MRAQEFLDANSLEPTEEVNCKKLPIDAAALADKLAEVSRVLVTKGKKILDLDPSKDKDEILQTAIGRSGNLRAPSIRHGKLMIVGFSTDAYGELCS